jgi:hypothetical protein
MLGPPHIAESRIKTLSNQLGDLILESFATLIAERQIVWIRADAKITRLRCWGVEDQHDGRGG